MLRILCENGTDVYYTVLLLSAAVTCTGRTCDSTACAGGDMWTCAGADMCGHVQRCRHVQTRGGTSDVQTHARDTWTPNMFQLKVHACVQTCVYTWVAQHDQRAQVRTCVGKHHVHHVQGHMVAQLFQLKADICGEATCVDICRKT